MGNKLELLAKPRAVVSGMTLEFPETNVPLKFREIVRNERNNIL